MDRSVRFRPTAAAAHPAPAGACISAAAEDGAGAIAHTISFGPTVNISSSKKPAVCTTGERLLQRAGKLYRRALEGLPRLQEERVRQHHQRRDAQKRLSRAAENDPKGLINRELSRLDDKVARSA